MARDRKKGAAADRRRVPKKKVSVLSSENITWIDYKDVNLLRRFMSERAKIRARRVTGNTAQQQRAVARAIRIAREMALLPYSVRQVTQRSRSSRRERERERERMTEAEVTREVAEDGGEPAEMSEGADATAAAPSVDGEGGPGDVVDTAEATPAADDGEESRFDPGRRA
jgi:small subunit ribosomal protein S18